MGKCFNLVLMTQNIKKAPWLNPFKVQMKQQAFITSWRKIQDWWESCSHGKTSPKLLVCIFSHKVTKKSKYKNICIFVLSVGWQHCNGSTIPCSTEDGSSWARTAWLKCWRLLDRNWKLYRTGRLISSWPNSFFTLSPWSHTTRMNQILSAPP